MFFILDEACLLVGQIAQQTAAGASVQVLCSLLCPAQDFPLQTVAL